VGFFIRCQKCETDQVIEQSTIQSDNWENNIQLDCTLGSTNIMLVCTHCKNEIKLEI